jgi:hypothetical protein
MQRQGLLLLPALQLLPLFLWIQVVTEQLPQQVQEQLLLKSDQLPLPQQAQG